MNERKASLASSEPRNRAPSEILLTAEFAAQAIGRPRRW